MKTSVLLTVCVFLSVAVRGQQLDEPPLSSSKIAQLRYEVGERGPHHRIWNKITIATNELGKMKYATNIAYIELATGLHYSQNGQWRESQEAFVLAPGWALARKGPHKVGLARNLNAAGSVVFELPDGQVVRSHIVGLAYLDSESNQSVILGYIKDCTGKLIGTNQIVYEDAFTEVKADVRYTYRRSGFGQDVILRQALPEPQELGLNPSTTKLAVFTEFDSGPAPEVRKLGTRSDQDVAAKAADSQADATDADITLQFGEMQMGKGKAFVSGEEGPALRKQVPVLKKWVEVQGRKILFEEVPLPKIKADLDALPKQSSVKSKKWSKTTVVKMQLPKLRDAQSSPRMFEVASATQKQAGYVLDYEILGGGFTNYTFRSDLTYYVSGTVNLYGTNTFEGGTVLKFNPTNYHALNLNGGSVVCKTGPYRPVVMTSQNDDSVGQQIAGSTGSPTPEYIDSYYLVLDHMTNAVLDNFRMSYGNVSFTTYYSSNIVMSDLQILESAYPIYPVLTTGLHLRNALIYNTGDTVIWNDTSSVTVEHATVNQSGWFGLKASFSGASIAATNCLLVGASSLGDCPITTNCVFLTSDTNVFQTVGAGRHYLATNTYRNLGTTNIDSALLAGLAKKTTYPPILRSNVPISAVTTLSPQATRDGDMQPDVGYHYEPLDYIFGGVNLYAAVDIDPGTVIGWFGDSDGASHTDYPHGIATDGAPFTSRGTVTAPCTIAHLGVVQEGNRQWSSYPFAGALLIGSDADVISCRFTRWFTLNGNASWHLGDEKGGAGSFAECEFYNGSLLCYESVLNFTNCLFFREAGGFVEGAGTFENCTFYKGRISPNGSILVVTNSVFDGTGFGDGWGSIYADYNAYNTNALSWRDPLFTNDWTGWGGLMFTAVNSGTPSSGAHDVANIFDWKKGPLGDFYLPTNSVLINVGSISANFLGLYHFTTTTNQVKETNTVVDIGYHYVAVDGNGNPVDTDGDGVPDYLEDLNGNGNGVDDAQSWLFNRYNGLSPTKGLQVFTPLK